MLNINTIKEKDNCRIISIITGARSLHIRNMIQILCKREKEGHLLNLIKKIFRNLKVLFLVSKSYSQYLYQFPRFSSTKYHKLGGFKEQKFISSQFWNQKSKVKLSVGLDYTGTSEGEWFMIFFQFLEISHCLSSPDL